MKSTAPAGGEPNQTIAPAGGAKQRPSSRLAPVPALLIAAGEPSKVPFYIAGGLLVMWALSLAAVGLTRPAFPVQRPRRAA